MKEFPTTSARLVEGSKPAQWIIEPQERTVVDDDIDKLIDASPDALIWSDSSSELRGKPSTVEEIEVVQWRKPMADTLIQFSKLHKAEPEVIAEFARCNGVFRAEKRIRELDRRALDISLPDGSVWAMGHLVGQGTEPLALWRHLSLRFRAILQINKELTRKGKFQSPMPAPGLPEHWKILGVEPAPQNPADSQYYLLREINHLLESGRVGLGLGILALNHKRTDWKLRIFHGGLLGALAYQLLLMVGGGGGYVCDGCSYPYIRTKRAPRPGVENFCTECEGRVPQQRATARHKIKIAQAKSKGKS